MPQQELANRIGTHKPNISRIESGQQNISLDTMLKIASALNKEISFELKEKPVPAVSRYSLRLYDEFVRHPSLNLPEERLVPIEQHIRKRVRELLALPRK